uniref:Uncharacterized protein n=1 Tax=Kalanchoe fedtschenkoi TaxID=63787 RepID=A0A7N1A9B3_KALFE
MDESWRMRIGMPRRRSTEGTPSYLKHPIFGGGSESLNPNNNSYNGDDDFSDVFGGPPRTLHLSRNLSGTNFFQDEISKVGEYMFGTRSGSSKKSSSQDGVLFGFDEYEDDVRFRTRSHSRSTKSKSSSDELSLSPSYSFSGFASKLRPVNVPGRWNPKPVTDHSTRQKMQEFPINGKLHPGKQCKKKKYDANMAMMMMMMGSNSFGFFRRVLSPERDVGKLDSHADLKMGVEDFELCSPPSSAKSSVCQEPEADKSRNEGCVTPEEIVDDEDEDDEIMSSYVIEINDFNWTVVREESVEAVGVDEAIAWAKEKYQSGMQQQDRDQSNEPQEPEVSACSPMLMDEDLTSSFAGDESSLGTTENGTLETQKDEEQKAMELLDEEVKLWSAYKETDIRLLLSTLHHILWPSSGWSVVSLADIIESCQVRRAYQKARLCLHPDKLQQRGATPPQKHVAAEAFSILQTAWEAFNAQNSC